MKYVALAIALLAVGEVFLSASTWTAPTSKAAFGCGLLALFVAFWIAFH